MALSSTGILLPIPEELHNQLISLPTSHEYYIPCPKWLLIRIYNRRYGFRIFCDDVRQINHVPVSRDMMNSMWMGKLMEGLDEWKEREGSRLIWHMPLGKARWEEWSIMEGIQGWYLAWEAVQNGNRDMGSESTEKYFTTLKKRRQVNGAYSVKLEGDASRPPYLHPIMLPADYNHLRDSVSYQGIDPGYYIHLEFFQHQLSQAEHTAAESFYNLVTSLSIQLANNPGMELPDYVMDEDSIVKHETRLDVGARLRQKDEMMGPRVKRTDSGNHAVHDMRRRSMSAQKRKAPDDSGAMQIDKDPSMDMDVDSHTGGVGNPQGPYKAEKKRLKNEQRAEKKRQNNSDREKARQRAREEALARKMNSALNDLEGMHLDEDPFIDPPTESKMRDEAARKAQAKAEMDARKAERDTEGENERQRVRDEALALEMENALEDLEVMGLADDMTSPQKRRLQARQLKKVEMERLESLERPRKKKKNKAKKERKQRVAAEYYDSLGGYQAGGLMYNDSVEGEAGRREAADRGAARLEEVMRANIEEMRRMCVDEGEKQSGEVVMDMDTGKTLGNKRQRSESL